MYIGESKIDWFMTWEASSLPKAGYDFLQILLDVGARLVIGVRIQIPQSDTIAL